MKALAVKLWVSSLLVLLMAYAGYSLWKRSRDLAEASASQQSAGYPVESSISDPTAIAEVSKPLDLASFTFTERSGKQMCLEKLRGRVWLLSMFFSSCPNECLTLNRTIAVLHHDPKLKDLQFVSVSVDPADTPQALRDYAKVLGADPQRWLFFTGDLSEVSRFGAAAKISARYKTHDSRLLLFDRTGRLRGIFAYNEPQHIERLKSLVAELLKEPAPANPGKTAASP